MIELPAFLAPYCSLADDGTVRVTAQQASSFAKDVAGDFNPLHDVGTRRFCVPGDLLFSVVLMRYGLSTNMTFRFRGMVDADEPVYCPPDDGDSLVLTDRRGGVLMEIEREGGTTRDESAIEAFVRQYVAFSGRTFPHYLIPVLAENRVMFHPDRPTVIYDSMGFTLEQLDLDLPELDLEDATLNVAGKRGDAVMRFGIHEDGQSVGAGWKKLIMSGLREYDEDAMNAFVGRFNRHRADYEARRDGREAGDSEH